MRTVVKTAGPVFVTRHMAKPAPLVSQEKSSAHALAQTKNAADDRAIQAIISVTRRFLTVIAQKNYNRFEPTRRYLVQAKLFTAFCSKRTGRCPWNSSHFGRPA